ncbi:glycosyltransferase family 2 protein [Pedobacter immunditicola]|uniref:glycosyltransferase family 2 protein n=1 Tax=Pedobacter immunditicola TaxID=3133440 RepID=UPI0030B700AA
MELKISIITINYNNADGLHQTIKSVLKQTYTDIQYLVIDGDSTDDSKSILAQYQREISFSVSERDKGIYEAMNKGIRAAVGDYLLFLNSGDVLVTKSVISESVAAGLNADLVSANMHFADGDRSYIWTPPESISFGLFYHSSLPHPSTFIKRTLFNTVGYYDERLRIVSDWKFTFLAAYKYNCSYNHIDVLLAEYKADGISSDPKNLPAIMVERNLVLTTYFSNFLMEYQELEAARKQLSAFSKILKIKKFFRLS